MTPRTQLGLGIFIGLLFLAGLGYAASYARPAIAAPTASAGTLALGGALWTASELLGLHVGQLAASMGVAVIAVLMFATVHFRGGAILVTGHTGQDLQPENHQTFVEVARDVWDLHDVDDTLDETTQELKAAVLANLGHYRDRSAGYDYERWG